MDANTNPYIQAMRDHDVHEADLQRWRRWLSIAVIGLSLCLIGSVYGNLYLLQPPVAVHYLNTVDGQGRISARVLPRADQLPADDPLKEFIIQSFIKDHIANWRSRPLDTGFLRISYNVARENTAGAAWGKFKADYDAENPWTRIQKEGVQVLFEGLPRRLTSKTWYLKWQEKVTNINGNDSRIELWEAFLTLAEDPTKATETNLFGLKIVDIEKGKIG